MPMFAAADGTQLAYRLTGDGPPLLCLPGGPMLSAGYLDDLGGLSSAARLVLLDPRGTGASAVPADPSTYRCDRQVADVEALRRHLGLERAWVLGHSAGANLAVRYAERHPDRLAGLVLVTPSPFAVGVTVAAADRKEVLDLRRDEPWHAAAADAFTRASTGTAGEADWAALAPLRHGRWDAATQAFDARMSAEQQAAPATAFLADGAFDPPATRAAMRTLDAPVVVIAGGVDGNSPPRAVAEIAALFPSAGLDVLPGGGHFPWQDDPAWFVRTVQQGLQRRSG